MNIEQCTHYTDPTSWDYFQATSKIISYNNMKDCIKVFYLFQKCCQIPLYVHFLSVSGGQEKNVFSKMFFLKGL